jgi:hypothetical protein
MHNAIIRHWSGETGCSQGASSVCVAAYCAVVVTPSMSGVVLGSAWTLAEEVAADSVCSSSYDVAHAVTPASTSWSAKSPAKRAAADRRKDTVVNSIGTAE